MLKYVIEKNNNDLGTKNNIIIIYHKSQPQTT